MPRLDGKGPLARLRHWLRPRAGAGILFYRHVPDGAPEVLLGRRAAWLRHAPGMMTYPGGGRNPGESAEENALREAWEEAARGLPRSFLEDPRRFGPLRSLRVLSLRPIFDYEYETFACEVLASDGSWPQANSEMDFYAWYPLDRLPRRLHGEARAAIRALARRLARESVRSPRREAAALRNAAR